MSASANVPGRCILRLSCLTPSLQQLGRSCMAEVLDRCTFLFCQAFLNESAVCFLAPLIPYHTAAPSDTRTCALPFQIVC